MGNIIGMLAGELMSGSSVKQVAKAANVNEKQAENIMGNAIPLLVQAMSVGRMASWASCAPLLWVW